MAKSFFEASPFNGMTFTEDKINVIFDTALYLKTKAIFILLQNDEGQNVGFISGYKEAPLFAKEEIASELAWWVDEDYRKTRKSHELVLAFEDWAVRTQSYAINMASITGFSPESVNKLYEKKGYVNTENSYLRIIQ